jgi:hypothetical protein
MSQTRSPPASSSVSPSIARATTTKSPAGCAEEAGPAQLATKAAATTTERSHAATHRAASSRTTPTSQTACTASRSSWWPGIGRRPPPWSSKPPAAPLSACCSSRGRRFPRQRRSRSGAGGCPLSERSERSPRPSRRPAEHRPERAAQALQRVRVHDESSDPPTRGGAVIVHFACTRTSPPRTEHAAAHSAARLRVIALPEQGDRHRPERAIDMANTQQWLARGTTALPKYLVDALPCAATCYS